MDAPERRLAAVLFADIVGYSSLSSVDEGAAMDLLVRFHAVSRETISSGGGRLIKFIGDAAFAEFGSTERAVRAAQELLSAFCNPSDPTVSRGQLRIAIHVGDVMVGADNDLFGDGVNVAARLQNEAAPGQILVSQDVWRQLRQRRSFAFQSLGERRLKGIHAPVWVFAVTDAPASPAAGDAEPEHATAPVRRRSRLLRLVQVGAAYAAVSVAVVLATAVLVRRLGLETWVLPAAIGLLVVGLLVVLGTAWVQSRPTWERPVGQPAPWSLDVPDIIGSVSRRKVPELTWTRTFVGGLAAFALLFASAGGYMWVRDVLGDAFSPDPLLAGPEPALAILPFGSEADTGVWAEGVPDLLALTLDGVQGLRVIDPGVVYAQMSGVGPGGSDATAVRVGQAVGARFAATGSVQRSPSEVRVEVELRDVVTGQVLGRAEAGGEPDSLSTLVEELAARLVATGVLPVEAAATDEIRLRDLATSSPVALREYLRGERDLRRSDWTAAIGAYEAAVRADPEFALALYRLSLARSWTELPHLPTRDPAAERALSLAGDLPERDRLLIEGLVEVNRSSSRARPVLERLTTLYPDDADGWFLLGDALFHSGAPGQESEARAALERVLDLAPGFGPAYPHLIEAAQARGDTAGVRTLVERYRLQEPTSPLLPGLEWAMTLGASANGPTAADSAALLRSRYESLADGGLSVVRDRARRDVHPALQERLQEADAMWNAAEAAADANDFARALQSLQAAGQRYDQLLRDGETLDGVEGERAALRQVRESTSDGDVLAEIDRLDAAAARALGDGRFAVAAETLRGTADRLAARVAEIEAAEARAAEEAPSESPDAPVDAGLDDDAAVEPEAPAPAPSAVAAELLASLETAMEAEDIARVRALWTSISADEVRGLEALFSAVRDLSVEYAVESLSERGPRLVLNVATTYRFFAEQSREVVSQRTAQIFELERVGGTWLIVASR